MLALVYVPVYRTITIGSTVSITFYNKIHVWTVNLIEATVSEQHCPSFERASRSFKPRFPRKRVCYRGLPRLQGMTVVLITLCRVNNYGVHGNTLHVCRNRWDVTTMYSILDDTRTIIVFDTRYLRCKLLIL